VPVERQIAIIFCGTHGLLADVPLDKVKEFEGEYLDYLEVKHKDVMNKLKAGTLDKNIEQTLENVAKEISAKFKKKEI